MAIDPGVMEYGAQAVASEESLIDFRKFYIRSGRDVECAHFHELWDRSLLQGSGHIAFEAFRESGKTEYAIRTNLLHALTFPTEGREYILLINSTRTIAEGRIKAIQREFTENARMTWCVSDIIEQSGRAFEVWYKGDNKYRKVRIETYGRGTAVRGANWGGRRPDLIICDDLQDFEDLESEIQPEKDWKWFLSDVMDLGQKSRIFMIGNNIGEKCIMEKVIGSKKELNFEGYVIPICKERPIEGLELGELYDPAWPAKYDIETIIEERERYRKMEQLDIWYRNKMCKTIAPDSQMFKRKHFKYYDSRNISTRDMNVYMVFDPASSEADTADRSAIITVGVDVFGHWFVLDLWAGRVKPSESFDMLFRLVSKWQPICVGYEKVQYQSAVEDFLNNEMPRRGIRFNVIPLNAGRKKELRISTALQPRYVQGMIWHPMGSSWVDMLEDELLAFPYGAHDDTIDALAYIEQIGTKPYSRRRQTDRMETRRELDFNTDLWGDQ